MEENLESNDYLIICLPISLTLKRIVANSEDILAIGFVMSFVGVGSSDKSCDIIIEVAKHLSTIL